MKHYIDADAAIRHIYALAEDARKRDIEPEFSALWVIEFLKDFPYAVVDKRKIGYWYGKDGGHKCSRCGAGSSYKCLFCPNCGAKMESEGNE